jgi:glucose/arabinose dehydrogenase
VFGILLLVPAMLSAQVTHGNKPQLPAPFATKSAGNPPEETMPPKGFLPAVPAGFQINLFASDFKEPRWLAVAPNGDIFLADTHGGAIYILRDPQQTGGTQQRVTFLSGLDEPFGIVVHDDYIYVGDTNAVLRYKFDPKTSKRLGEAEKLMDLPRGGHSTRALVFSADGKHLFVSVGSKSNVDVEKDSMPPVCVIRWDWRWNPRPDNFGPASTSATASVTTCRRTILLP